MRPLFFSTQYYAILGKLLQFIHVQLFITLIALPILLAWGLPISLMSCIGNLLFLPFLTLFLLFSCIIFFLEVCHIPNGIVITCLEYVTHCWLWIIAQGKPSWLIPCAQPSMLLLIALPCITLCILHTKNYSYGIRTLLLLSTLTGTIVLLRCYSITRTCSTITLACNKGFITLIRAPNGKLIMIDPGVLGQSGSTHWVEYTLLQELTRNFGSITIDHCIIAKPGIATYNALEHLCNLATIRTVYLPVWHGEAEEKLLKAYGRMRYALEKQQGNLIRMYTKPMIIPLTHTTQMKIEPLDATISYKNTTVPVLHITLNGEQTYECYSQGYTPPEAAKILADDPLH